MEEVCEVMCAENIYEAIEVVDVKKVDYNCHLVTRDATKKPLQVEEEVALFPCPQTHPRF